MSERLVSVALPVGLDRAFTYSVPAEWASAPEPGTQTACVVTSHLFHHS